jgi:hypothetical protein
MFRLKKPLTLMIVNIEQNSDHDLIAFEPEFDMNLWGKTEEELVQAAKDELVFLYESYGMAHDHILTKGAQKLKRKILEFLEEC